MTLTPEKHAEKATERNLTAQQMEIAAYNRGEVGHALFGQRMAALNSTPSSIRKRGPDFEP